MPFKTYHTQELSTFPSVKQLLTYEWDGFLNALNDAIEQEEAVKFDTANHKVTNGWRKAYELLHHGVAANCRERGRKAERPYFFRRRVIDLWHAIGVEKSQGIQLSKAKEKALQLCQEHGTWCVSSNSQPSTAMAAFLMSRLDQPQQQQQQQHRQQPVGNEPSSSSSRRIRRLEEDCFIQATVQRLLKKRESKRKKVIKENFAKCIQTMKQAMKTFLKTCDDGGSDDDDTNDLAAVVGPAPVAANVAADEVVSFNRDNDADLNIERQSDGHEVIVIDDDDDNDDDDGDDDDYYDDDDDDDDDDDEDDDDDDYNFKKGRSVGSTGSACSPSCNTRASSKRRATTTSVSPDSLDRKQPAAKRPRRDGHDDNEKRPSQSSSSSSSSPTMKLESILQQIQAAVQTMATQVSGTNQQQEQQD